ncbi:MAG: long-chain fatty acid--CoA ligase [Betaproteobacteria bacterium RIFCSPLOWO2_12_FULL_68_19]|nr:MAG: long-chain fatty acid--CoA ligase [Betaproteobacteria bacterium RIFCSPLOWO2_12_FULL_68_19]
MFTRHFAHWPPGKPRTLELPRDTVYRNLEAVAAREPERAAIDYYGSRLSYAQLKRQVDALAAFLQQRCAVAKGDRVLLYLQNSPQFVIGFYAVLRADAVVVPVNPMNRTEELRHYVEDSDAAVAIVGQDVFRHIEPIAGLKHLLVATYSDYVAASADLPVPEFVRAPRERFEAGIPWEAAIAADLSPGPQLAGPEDLAVMPYTSGTTGKPKGCMHTHSSVQATTVPYLQWRGASDGSVVLAALPMFHVTGMQTGMNAPIHLGATLVILSRWDRDCAALQIERAKVTNWSAITTMMVDFLSNPNLARYDLSSLQVLGGGGAAMPEALARKLEEVIGLPFVEGYGLSETMAPTHINPPHRSKRQCGGIPFYNTDARVIDLESSHELPPNQVGEIIVRGPQLFRGYWKQPEASAQAFIEHDGERFFRTGDLGYYDEEGYFFITDRLKRMINCAGYKVWPAEVEAMLYAHPAIQEACVIGVRDAYRGETVKALVVLRKERADASPEDIIGWARERMAAFKVPRVVEFVESLPKTATGKILWRELQEKENRE